jgi:hypothetical protein
MTAERQHGKCGRTNPTSALTDAAGCLGKGHVGALGFGTRPAGRYNPEPRREAGRGSLPAFIAARDRPFALLRTEVKRNSTPHEPAGRGARRRTRQIPADEPGFPDGRAVVGDGGSCGWHKPWDGHAIVPPCSSPATGQKAVHHGCSCPVEPLRPDLSLLVIGSTWCHIQDSARHVWATVLHLDDCLAPGLVISDPSNRAKWQATACRYLRVWIERTSIRHFSAVELPAVIGGSPVLRPPRMVNNLTPRLQPSTRSRRAPACP